MTDREKGIQLTNESCNLVTEEVQVENQVALAPLESHDLEA